MREIARRNVPRHRQIQPHLPFHQRHQRHQRHRRHRRHRLVKIWILQMK